MAAPNQVPNLIGWWQAEDLSALADGASVTSWPGQVGPTFNSTTGGAAPTLQKNALGGKPGVRFTTGSVLRKIGGLTGFLNGVTGCTILVFAKQDSTGTARNLVFVSTGLSQSSARFCLRTATTGQGYLTNIGRRSDSDAASTITGGGYLSDAWTDTQRTHTFATAVDFANTSVRLLTDGVLVNSSTSYLTAGSASATDPAAISIGCSGGNATEGWDGLIFEIAIFNRVLPDAEVATIHAGWAVKYNAVPALDETVPDLPFTFDVNQLATSSKKVFALYMPTFPTKFYNVAEASDYWKNYVTAPSPSATEGAKYDKYGGYLRDRTIVRPQPSTICSWRLDDALLECQRAKARGFDGFTICLEGLVMTTTQNWERETLVAIGAAMTGLKCIPMIDTPIFSSELPTPSDKKYVSAQEMAEAYKKLWDYGSMYTLPTGEYVIAPFTPEATTTAQFWADVKTYLQTNYGIEVALWPIFQAGWSNGTAASTAWKDISYGYSRWGSRNKTAVAGQVNDPSQSVNTWGKRFMASIAFGDFRPRTAAFDEYSNTETLEATWNIAINGSGGAPADIAHFITWNDYGENTHVSPSKRSGWSWTDLNAWWLSQYKNNGTKPAITKDGMYITHRVQTANGTYTYVPPSDTYQLSTLRGGSTPVRDKVEVAAFFTAPATVEIFFDNVSAGTWNAPAGFNRQLFDLQPGTIKVVATRSAATVLTVNSNEPVQTAPYYVQDEHYIAAGAVSTASTLPPAQEVPETVSGLVGWYKAGDLTLASGASVNAWASSGYGPTLNENTGGTAPIYTANAYNGFASVQFSTGSVLRTTSTSALSGFMNGVPGATVVAFVKQTAIGTTKQITFIGTGSNAVLARFGLTTTNASYGYLMASGRRLDTDSSQTVVGSYGPGTLWPAVVTGRWDLTNRTVQAYVNGSQVGSSAAYQTAGSASATDAKSFALGCNGGSATEGFSGHLFEVLVYNRTLSDAELANIHMYLFKKYYGFTAYYKQAGAWGQKTAIAWRRESGQWVPHVVTPQNKQSGTWISG